MSAITNRQAPVGKRSASRDRQVIAALNFLEAEDFQMRSHLLDAAVAGAILARDPGDKALRHEATQAWQSLAATLSHHVAAEEAMAAKWVKSKSDTPKRVIVGARERLARLRGLAAAVSGVDFARAADSDVRRGARALCSLAMDLDDLIDSDERELFPLLQRSLFAHRDLAHAGPRLKRK
ncbi:MAG TPA: hypothetical protein VMV27_08525 [Candidatus Binataceae bacterium]|nr:hypothetical protein [Candidatus Binataceae bacterium]